MSPSAVLRIKKLHASNIQSSAHHNSRKRDTPNADRNKTNVYLIGSQHDNLTALIHQRIGNKKIRKNAVLAVEILMSASPEYFRPFDKSEAGYWQEDKLKDFVDTSLDWLKERYGDKIVLAHLHLDEVSPHIHAYLVPLVEGMDKEGNKVEKLNCRGLFGSREKLRELQDDFAQAVQHLGIERGIKGSKATHTDIAKYYTSVNQSLDLSLDAEGIEHVIEDRKRLLKENKELKRTAQSLSKKAEIKDKQLVMKDKEIFDLKTQKEVLEQELEELKNKYKTQNKQRSKQQNNALKQPLVVLVSTHQDAIALATLKPQKENTVYIALSGKEPPYELLRSMPKKSIFIALNRDSANERLAYHIHDCLLTQSVFSRPTNIDWVTELAKVQKQKEQQLEIDQIKPETSKFTPNLTTGFGNKGVRI